MGTQPQPELLYHYTSAGGLLGIVDEQGIWATRVLFLNDSKEIGHAYDVARELLPKFEPRFPDGTRAFHDYLATAPIIPWIFVAAWTEEGDQLSQWRGYGGSGPAYSLGFKRAALEEAARTHGWQLRRCIYDPDELRTLIEGALDEFYTKFEHGLLTDQHGSTLNADHPRSADLFQSQLFGFLMPIASFLKHDAFAEEREWRLVSPVTDQIVIKHRAGATGLIPYHSFPLPRRNDFLDIVETVVGPAAEPVRADRRCFPFT